MLQNHLLIIKRGHLQNQIIKTTGFSLKSARWQSAFNNHYLKITVEQYYFAKHKISLKYPNLPMMIESQNLKQLNYYLWNCYLFVKKLYILSINTF